jgi:hypothetical protein
LVIQICFMVPRSSHERGRGGGGARGPSIWHPGTLPASSIGVIDEQQQHNHDLNGRGMDMSSFSKAFKKVTKSVKKTADKATHAVSQGANQAANAVSQGVSQAAGQAAGIAQETASAISKTAQQTYEAALDAGVSAYNQVQDQIEKWINDAALDLLVKAATSAYDKNRRVVSDLARSMNGLLSDPAAHAQLEILGKDAAGKKHDPQTDQHVKALASSPQMAPANSSASSSGWGSISIGYGGNAAYGAGGEGSYGYAYQLSKLGVGGFFSLGGVLGAMGGSVNVQLGVWAPPPSGLAGPYLAVELEVEIEGGGGIQVIFPLPATDDAWQNLVTGKASLDPVGIVIFAGGGEEVSAALGGGYTWIF